MVLYNSPQNINIFFMLISIYIFFTSIYQLIIIMRLLSLNGESVNIENMTVGLPLSLNLFGLIIFIILFIICLIKMLCRKAKYKEYIFTLVYCILIILYLTICSISLNISVLNKYTLSVKFVEFCYINTIAILIVSAFATILYICCICKNDSLDTISRRLDLYNKDPMFKQTVAEQVGKSSEDTFGLNNTNQLQEICSTPFIPGTYRTNLAENDISKDVCNIALNLGPNDSL